MLLAWSADTVGQGWGINREWGGLRMYETMRQARPDVFVHCGDTIYADQPVRPEVKLDDGTIWRNVVTDAKSKVAETLDDFRGNYLYNLLDDNVRRFNAEVPQIVLWDDHEVLDNWYPQEVLADARYTEKKVSVLRRARAEGVPRAPADPHRREGAGPDLPLVRLRPLAGDLRPRPAQLPRSQLAQQAAAARSGHGDPRPRAGPLAGSGRCGPRRRPGR